MIHVVSKSHLLDNNRSKSELIKFLNVLEMPDYDGGSWQPFRYSVERSALDAVAHGSVDVSASNL